MTYNSELKKENRQKTETALIDLWCKCSSYDEFVIQAVSKGLYTRKYAFLFWMHRFKKEHPILHFLATGLTLGTVGAVNALAAICFSGLGAVICMIASVIFLFIMSDSITEFSWKIGNSEHGIPIA